MRHTRNFQRLPKVYLVFTQSRESKLGKNNSEDEEGDILKYKVPWKVKKFVVLFCPGPVSISTSFCSQLPDCVATWWQTVCFFGRSTFNDQSIDQTRRVWSWILLIFRVWRPHTGHKEAFQLRKCLNVPNTFSWRHCSISGRQRCLNWVVWRDDGRFYIILMAASPSLSVWRRFLPCLKTTADHLVSDGFTLDDFRPRRLLFGSHVTLMRRWRVYKL